PLVLLRGARGAARAGGGGRPARSYRSPVAERVPVDLVRPPRGIRHPKEEGTRVHSPHAALVDPGDHIRKIIATRQISEAQLVDLVAGTVDRVGEQPTVRADRTYAELYVRRGTRDLVQIEEHLNVVLFCSHRTAAELAELPIGAAAAEVEVIALAPRGRALRRGRAC